MTRQLFSRAAILVGLLALGAPAMAQSSAVSTTDIQRLQDRAYQTGNDVSRLRSSDPNLATRLEGELDDLRDEIVYLKVKLRKDGNVSRQDYSDLRDRLDNLRSQARGDAASRGNSGSLPSESRHGLPAAFRAVLSRASRAGRRAACPVMIAGRQARALGAARFQRARKSTCGSIRS